MFRKEGTLDGMTRGFKEESRGNRDQLWNMIIEVMYEHNLDMPTLIKERRANDVADIVSRRMKQRGMPVNPHYMPGALPSRKPTLSSYELNLDGSYKNAATVKDDSDSPHVTLWADEPKKMAWDEAKVRPKYAIAQAVGDLAVAYPRLDPARPSTIPTFLYPRLGEAPQRISGFVRPPGFGGKDLPWYERALIPLTWLVALLGSLSALGKTIVALVVLVLVLMVVF